MRTLTSLRNVLAAVGGLLLAQVALADGPLQFYSITPCRVADTRTTTPPALSAGVARALAIAGQCGVPATAKAAALNFTAIGPTADGFLKVWAYGATVPSTSTLNFIAGEPAIANGAVVQLTSGASSIYVVMGTAGGAATMHLAVDVVGYYQ